MIPLTIRAIRRSSFTFAGVQRSFASSTTGHAPIRSGKTRRSVPWISSALYSAALTLSTTTVALCENDEDFISKIKSKLESSSLTNPESMDDLLSTLGASVQIVFESGIPTNLSYGFFAGYVSGLAFKKIGRVASLSLGMGFLCMQTLAYQGYIVVNHEKISKEVENILDRNNDGKVDVEDLKGVIEDVRKVAEHGLGFSQGGLAVSGGGFGLGFYGGLKSG